MKKRNIHITVHNPNNEQDSQKLAESFIVKAAESAISRLITERQENNTDRV